MGCGVASNVLDVLVTTVTRRGEDDDSLAVAVESRGEAAHCLHGVRVVPVVENDAKRVLVVDVHAPGGLEERRIERT